LDLDEAPEEIALVGLGEAEELDRALLRGVRVDVHEHREAGPGRRQRGQRRQRDAHEVADARHVDDDVIARLLDERAAQVGDHLSLAPRPAPRKAGQSATARASLASTGGGRRRPQIARTIAATSGLVARPEPTTARFTRAGAYSCTGMPPS